jgi:hypothetical protein
MFFQEQLKKAVKCVKKDPSIFGGHLKYMNNVYWKTRGTFWLRSLSFFPSFNLTAIPGPERSI